MVFTRPEYNEKKLSPSAISVVRKGSIGLFRFRPVVSRRPGQRRQAKAVVKNAKSTSMGKN